MKNKIKIKKGNKKNVEKKYSEKTKWFSVKKNVIEKKETLARKKRRYMTGDIQFKHEFNI